MLSVWLRSFYTIALYKIQCVIFLYVKNSIAHNFAYYATLLCVIDNKPSVNNFYILDIVYIKLCQGSRHIYVNQTKIQDRWRLSGQSKWML